MVRRVLLSGLSGLMLTIGARAAEPQAPARLESFLGYTFVGELTAPGTADQIAWVELHRGIRNIWTAHAPDYAPRRLTNGTSDDGQELSNLAWSPDGRVLAYERGAVEHNGWANGLPAANPASATVQPQMEIWASVTGAAPVKLAEGEEPTVSASGAIAFISNNQVWTVPAAGGTKPAKLFYDRGKVGDITWSPDGTRLAFTSRRGDHSFVGVYSGPDKPIVWLAATTGYDDTPVWSPDGTRLAYVHRQGIADILVSALEETPNPFSIHVATADGENDRAVYQSPKTLNGSYPQVPDGLFLMWAADDRLTFRAELDGWPHLYSVRAAGGGEPTLLTPGDYMVEHVSMSPDRRSLLYSANSGSQAGDTDRRHLFRVAVDQPRPVALTPGTGLEWLPRQLAGNKLAYVAATPAVPPRIALANADGGGMRALDTGTNQFPVDAAVIPRPVTFSAADGLVIHGQLFLPRGGGKHPALIYVHGGPPRQMLLGWSYMDYYTHGYAMNQYWASRGYAVLSVNYRLGIGYGRAFQHPAKAGASGDAEYQDVLAGAHYLQALPQVDPARIGIWGGSYGGLLTAQALARNSDVFKAGVDFHGVHDWTIMPGRSLPTRFEQNGYQELTRLAFESSPDAAISGWRSPVLLIHGDDDRNVRFDQSVDIARRLAAQGTPYQELIFPNEIHGFLRYDTWRRADSAMVRFLDANLKP